MVAVILLLGFGGYYYLSEIAPLKTAQEELQQKNQELQYQLEQLEQKNRELSSQLEEKLKELSQEKEQEISKLKTTYEDLILEMKEQVEKGEITITQLADQLKVNIVDRILFPSGQAEISPAGLKVLERVGKILKENSDKLIRVEGHTDNVPIHPNLQKDYPTNWELSTARATNVVRFLQEKVGIDARNLEAAGLAEYRPIATNATPKGRAQNRRIEILLLPQPKNESRK
jgi:chemotaxis protein MotB